MTWHTSFLGRKKWLATSYPKVYPGKRRYVKEHPEAIRVKKKAMTLVLLRILALSDTS